MGDEKTSTRNSVYDETMFEDLEFLILCNIVTSKKNCFLVSVILRGNFFHVLNSRSYTAKRLANV